MRSKEMLCSRPIFVDNDLRGALFRLCAITSALLSLTIPAHAQTAAVLQGTVMDPSDRVVTNAAIVAVHTATGTERETFTDRSGRYQLIALTAGEYHLEVRAPAFRSQTLERFIVDGGRTIVKDFRLGLGEVAEDVAVSATTSPIDRATVSVGHVMDERTVHEMPLNGRRFVDLGLMVPGSVTPPQGGFLSAPSRGDGFYGFNMGGSREDAVNFLVNGISVNEQFNDLTMQTSILTVREMKVENSTFSAQFGRNSGAVVNILTRSGSNRLRGEVFEFLRDDALDARNYFNFLSEEPEPFSRHQFGGSVGGPLIRNRTFFFTAYEGTRQRQHLDLNSLVLSDAERASARVPAVVRLLEFIPRANYVDAQGTSRFAGSATAPFDADQVSLDVTDATRSNSRLHGYYWFNRDQRREPTLQGNTIPGFGDIRRRRRHILTVSGTQLMSTSFVNEARFGFASNEGRGTPAVLLNPVDLGFSTGVNEAIGLPQISVGGGLNFGGPANFLTSRTGTTFTVSDAVSHQRARHAIRIGGEYRLYRNDSVTKDAGRFNFPTVADFIAGTANAFSVTLGDRHAHIRQWALGLFAQDQFTVRQNVTLDVGLRYDWYATPTERDDRFVVFDAATASLIQVGTHIDEIYGQNNRNVQPRAGIVWDPWGDGRTAVRAAYGLYANQPTTNVVSGATTNPPLVTPLSYSGPVGFESASRLARATGLSPSTVDPDFTNATTQSWNLNVQREIARNVAVMAGYFGARGVHLRISRNINQPLNGIRPFPVLSPSSPILPGTPLGNITQVEGAGRSTYNGLWLSLRGRISDGLRVTGSYTLASSKDYNSVSTQGVVVQNSYNLRGELGPSDFDARHRTVATMIYELPFRGSQLIEGWQLGLIVQTQSGSPVNIVTSNSALNGVPNTVRPDVTGTLTTIGDVNRWFDTSVFTAVNDFGNLGRNAIVGPRFNNTDLSVSKTTPIANVRIETRIEVFNLFNHPNFGQPGNVVGSGNFGVITSTRFPTGELGSSRQVQCSVQLTF
jgi:outer membrane receptor protein involved in Fe transport